MSVSESRAFNVVTATVPGPDVLFQATHAPKWLGDAENRNRQTHSLFEAFNLFSIYTINITNKRKFSITMAFLPLDSPQSKVLSWSWKFRWAKPLVCWCHDELTSLLSVGYSQNDERSITASGTATTQFTDCPDIYLDKRSLVLF